jgi:hypothetical protein
MTIGRPLPGDYAPFYQPYLEATQPADDALFVLASQDAVLAAMGGWSEAKAGHRYADGKWTVGQVVGHMADTERVFAYRLLRIARADETPLAGFDENAWQVGAGFESRTLASLVEELTAVRGASKALVRSLTAPALDREAQANGKRVTARALAWLIGGHFAHHAGVLRDRYGM